MSLAFVPAAGAAPSHAPAAGPALRGVPAGAPGHQARHGADLAHADAAASLLTAALAAASVAGSAAVVRRKTTRSRRVARLAEAAAEPAPPPPPPPFNPAEQIGVTQPLGYFDPLGFCKVGDEKGFHKLRCAELKHGRVSMLAAVGTVFQHYVKLPGCEKTPAGLAALGDGAGVFGFVCLLPVIGFLETVYWKDDLSKEPGNFGDPAGWAGTGLGPLGSYSDDMRNKEINNGRAAMFSIIGIMVAELATGKDGVQQLGF